jgi:hypothetical protein
MTQNLLFRGVSGSLKLGGQVVMRQLWRRAAAAGGAFYSANRWGGNCPLAPPPVTPLDSNSHAQRGDESGNTLLLCPEEATLKCPSFLCLNLLRTFLWCSSVLIVMDSEYHMIAV